MYVRINTSPVQPQFVVYPQRKSVDCETAKPYMRFTHQFVTIDKSLGKAHFELGIISINCSCLEHFFVFCIADYVISIKLTGLDHILNRGE